MNKIKITVIKKDFYEEFVKEYGIENFGKCTKFELGDVYVTHYEKPDGFCNEAWKAIQHYVFALCFGADGFWETWMKDRHISINTCNDGLRPVCFKIETVGGRIRAEQIIIGLIPNIIW